MAPVSAVIPCYNCKETIGRAIQSVAAQTLLPRELILVNDASTDDTLIVIQNAACCYPSNWIRIIALAENKGPGIARNVGWEAAQSPFITFLDADDSWHPSKIELQYGWMQGNPNVDLTGHFLVRETEDAEWTRPILVTATPVTKNQLLLFSPINPQTIMVRRDESIRFAEEQFSEDHYMLVNMACSGRNMFLLNAPLARRHKANFGAGGVSGNLWAMERDQLKNYIGLLHQHKIGACLFSLVTAWSVAKYVRRVILTCLRRFSWEA